MFYGSDLKRQHYYCRFINLKYSEISLIYNIYGKSKGTDIEQYNKNKLYNQCLLLELKI